MISPLRIEDNLPFISLRVWHEDKSLILSNVLVDTGSASSILKLDLVEIIGIKAEPYDILGTITGVGGSELVYLKTINTIQIGNMSIQDVEVDIGIMEYGFDIDGIIGMDLLLRMKTLIDLNEMRLLSRA